MKGLFLVLVASLGQLLTVHTGQQAGHLLSCVPWNLSIDILETSSKFCGTASSHEWVPTGFHRMTPPLDPETQKVAFLTCHLSEFLRHPLGHSYVLSKKIWIP